ncbi:MAG: toxin-antitoxin system YwqK family antitoxin [Marinifilaceae bacterium]
MRIILTALFCFLVNFSFGQIFEKENGLFYDKNDELYSGTYTEFYENGSKRVEMNLKEGRKHGKIMLYFQNENIQEVRSYFEGMMDGTWMTWNQMKIKIAEANYKSNLKHGKWYIWDNKGVKRYEMEYFNGKKIGIWSIWDEKGKLISQKNYSK